MTPTPEAREALRALRAPAVRLVRSHHFDGDSGQYDTEQVGLDIDGIVVWLGAAGYGRGALNDAWPAAVDNATAIAAAVNALPGLLDALEKAEGERDAMRAENEALKAWVREALPTIEAEAQPHSGYGYYRPPNPHDFHPDEESCRPEEIAAHAAACESYDRGESVDSGGCETATTEDGEVVAHILRAPWGIGSYTVRDPDAERLRDEGRALLAGGKTDGR